MKLAPRLAMAAVAGFVAIAPAAHADENAAETTLHQQFQDYYQGSFDLQTANKMAEDKVLEDQHIGSGFTSDTIIKQEVYMNDALQGKSSDTIHMDRAEYMKQFDEAHGGAPLTATIDSVKIDGQKATVTTSYSNDLSTSPEFLASIVKVYGEAAMIDQAQSTTTCSYDLDLSTSGTPFKVASEKCVSNVTLKLQMTY